MTAVSQNAPIAKSAELSAIPLELWKQAAAASVITFLLASLIVGIETVSSTGALAFTTRYKEVVIVTIAVFFGALVIGLMRVGRPLPALVGGGLVTLVFCTILTLQNPSEVRIQAVLIPMAATLAGLLTAALAGGKRRLLTIAACGLIPVVVAVLLERGDLRNQVLLFAIAAVSFIIVGVGAVRAGARTLAFAIGAAAVALLALAMGMADSTDFWRELVPFKSPIVNWGALLIPLSIFIRGARQTEHVQASGRPVAGQSATEVVQRLLPWVGAALIVIAVALPWLPLGERTQEKKIIDICTIVLTYIMLGWGLNIVVGLAGLLDLGYVAFYAVGAYTYAMLSVYLGWSFWVCLPLAGLLAATFGVLLGFPVLRLRGDYLAIVTLGFGEMIRIIIVNWRDLTGGPNGINRVPRASFFGLPMERNVPEGVTSFSQFFGLEYNPNHRVVFLYYLVLVAALVVNFFTLRIRKLPLGRAWEALREDETACRALGINPTNTKLTAFAIGAMFGGFAGSFFAVRNAFISPESFVFLESAIILAIVVLGGLGSQVGIVLAAAVLIGLPEMFRELSEYRMLAFGIGMVLIMIWRPGGLLARRDPTIRLHPLGGKPADAKR